MREDTTSRSSQSTGVTPASVTPLVASGPAVALWEITTACDHACMGCGNVFAHTGFPIPLADFSEGLSRLLGSITDIRLTGGEATLHPQFSAICELVGASGVSFSVLSNGDWRIPSDVVSLVRSFRNFRGFLISVHGHAADVHDRFVRSPGSFERVTGNIRLATDRGVYVSTNTILHRGVISHLEEIGALSHSLGASYAVFNRYYGAHPAWKISRDELAEAAGFLTKQRLAGRKMRLGNCVPKCVADCDCDGCPGGNYIVTIDPWLNVRPCNHAPLVVGSLRTADLCTLWHDEKMQRWRNAVPLECLKCCFRDQCAGGCRAEGLLLGKRGDPLIDPCRTATRPFRKDLLRLYMAQKFRCRCLTKKEHFGAMLTFEGEVMLVNHEGVDLLDDLTLGMDAAGVRSKYGHSGLQVLSEFLLSGFVEYVD